jgi:aminodeoxyfutalosine synthase
MLGKKIAQVALAFGVNDLDGTVIRKGIGHDAGATPQSLSRDGIVRTIGIGQAAGGEGYAV